MAHAAESKAAAFTCETAIDTSMRFVASTTSRHYDRSEVSGILLGVIYDAMRLCLALIATGIILDPMLLPIILLLIGILLLLSLLILG